MAYADPQTVTPSGGTAISLPRVSSGTNAGAFQSNDGLARLTVSHTYGKRVRHLIRVDMSKIAADPLLAGVNVRASMSAYLVVDVPTSGYSVAEQVANVGGLTAFLTAGSAAAVTKLLGGEN